MMQNFKSYIEDGELEILDEAGNISSTLAIRKFNQSVKYGRAVLKSKSVEDKLDNIARLGVDLASLVLMSIASSGKRSLVSNIAKVLSLRSI